MPVGYQQKVKGTVGHTGEEFVLLVVLKDRPGWAPGEKAFCAWVSMPMLSVRIGERETQLQQHLCPSRHPSATELVSYFPDKAGGSAPRDCFPGLWIIAAVGKSVFGVQGFRFYQS